MFPYILRKEFVSFMKALFSTSTSSNPWSTVFPFASASISVFSGDFFLGFLLLDQSFLTTSVIFSNFLFRIETCGCFSSTTQLASPSVTLSTLRRFSKRGWFYLIWVALWNVYFYRFCRRLRRTKFSIFCSLRIYLPSCVSTFAQENELWPCKYTPVPFPFASRCKRMFFEWFPKFSLYIYLSIVLYNNHCL